MSIAVTAVVDAAAALFFTLNWQVDVCVCACAHVCATTQQRFVKACIHIYVQINRVHLK